MDLLSGRIDKHLDKGWNLLRQNLSGLFEKEVFPPEASLSHTGYVVANDQGIPLSDSNVDAKKEVYGVKPWESLSTLPLLLPSNQVVDLHLFQRIQSAGSFAIHSAYEQTVDRHDDLKNHLTPWETAKRFKIWQVSVYDSPDLGKKGQIKWEKEVSPGEYLPELLHSEDPLTRMAAASHPLLPMSWMEKGSQVKDPAVQTGLQLNPGCPNHLKVGDSVQSCLIEQIDWKREVLVLKKGSSGGQEVSFGDLAVRALQQKGVEVQGVSLGKPAGAASPEELKEVLSEINSLIGMDKVKQQVQSFIHYVQLQQLRQEQGLTTNPISLHLAFVGPPGTGKTTVARLLGRAFKAMGILPSGHFVEANREKLVAGYVGQTAIKTKELIDQAEGGVLFIDEAYALSSKQADSSDYGKEAVATLIEAMETKKDRMAVIFAGYPQEMADFFQSNSGLRSRVKNFFEFNHYTPKELEAIFQRFCQEEQFSLTPEAEQKLNRVLKSVFDGKDSRTFGNGRVARHLFEDAKQNMGNRISVLETKGEPITKEMLTTFQSDDIPGFQGKSRGLVKAWKKVFHGTQE